jgi:phage terminase large subunit GpA-like protein
VVQGAVAQAMMPPPPPDVALWAKDHLEFEEGTPFPGPFDPARFPMLARIHECLSPEHPCREVTVRGSAQIGKTEAIIKPALGCWFDQAPERRLCFQGVFMQRSVVNAAGEGRRRGESGADTIHSDTARAPFSREGFCQMNNRRFCRSVGMQGR